MSSHQLSRLHQDHLDQASLLSQAEHWPHRKEDWEMLLALSVGSAAMSDEKVLGTALRTDYGPIVSTMNMIIVAQSERGKGLGRKLMEAVMETALDRELRLVATQDGLPLYEKLGFEAEGEITQCQGNIEALHPPTSTVTLAGMQDIEKIIQLDSQYLAADRSGLLRWLSQNGKLALTRSDTGEITGYAALRRFGRGHVIGPIIAPDTEHAQNLVRYLTASLGGAFIRIDTDNALGLEPWLKSIGLNRAGGGIRMRRNAQTQPCAVFGLCSQALG